MDKCILAEQCNENSIATPSWWPDVHASSICSWTNGVNYASNPSSCNNNNPQNPNSNCSNGEEDASNNSGLSMESSRRLVEKSSTNDPYGEAVSDNHHLWNQVLLGVGASTEELQNMSTRTEMFELACDYLKKIDSGWEYSNPTNLNHCQKKFDSYNNDGQHQNKNPDSQFNQFNGQFATLKNENTADSDIDREGLLRRGLNSHAIDQYRMGINDMSMSDMECHNGSRSCFLDLVAFGSCLNKPPSHSNTPTKINARGNGVVNERKRKKSEHQSCSLLKKTKLENSTVSSTKVQVPKAKLGDKITALQQIVSPFGKTDTASVLWEAKGASTVTQQSIHENQYYQGQMGAFGNER